MSSTGLTDSTKPNSSEATVTVCSLAQMTGFPEDYIVRELVIDADSEMSVEELRMRVLKYLDNNF